MRTGSGADSLISTPTPGPETAAMTDQLPVPVDDAGLLERDRDYETVESGVFVAGDAGRGQSLIVWAIAEGRAAASAIDRFLEGTTELPFPVKPTDRSFRI